MGVEHGTDKAFLGDRLLSKCFQPCPLKGILLNRISIGRIYLETIFVSHLVVAFIGPIQALEGKGRQNLMATVADGIGISCA